MPPSAPRIAAALLLARAFDALPAAARALVSGGAPVVVDVADGAMLDALKGEWRGMFFDAPFRLIDLVRTAPGRRSALDGAYIMLKEPLKGAAKERLERVAADMCGYALPFVAFSPDGRACLPKVVNDAVRHRIWCDGCGNYGIWTAVKYALVELHLHPWQVCLCYDVGCHGNGSDKIEGYRFHGLHGRVIPFAAGTKLANMKVPVIAFGGDGATFSEGIGHLVHGVRSNYPITFVLHNNTNYGLTTGQASSLTPQGQPMNTSPNGIPEHTLASMDLIFSLNPTFVARGFSGDIKLITRFSRLQFSIAVLPSSRCSRRVRHTTTSQRTNICWTGTSMQTPMVMTRATYNRRGRSLRRFRIASPAAFSIKPKTFPTSIIG